MTEDVDRAFAIFLALLLTSTGAGCLNSPGHIETIVTGVASKPVCDDITKNVTCRIVPPLPVPSFELINTDNSTFNMSEMNGKVVLVAFIFTRCIDICPVVSANLRYVDANIDRDLHDQLGIISITVDPYTDSTDVLSEYSKVRNLSWPHLTGTGLEPIESVWRNFDVGITNYDTDTDRDGIVDGFDLCPETPENEKVDSDGCGIDTQNGTPTEGRSTGARHHPLDYWVEHTTATIILDKNLNQRVWWGDTAWVPELVLADIYELINETK